MSLEYSPLESINETASTLLSNFLAGVTRPLSFRKAQMRAFLELCTNHQAEICEALFKDLHKSSVESCAEIHTVVGELNKHLAHLDEWTAPTYPSVGLINKPNKVHIRSDPLGMVLIIGPWNYPFHLVMMPLVGAMSAGNTVVIKPSEVAPHTAALIARLVPRYLDERAYRVVLGSVAETTHLLSIKFDHIFFTGSCPVGKIVMAAAAKHLTPVTLELGGKSPVFIDAKSDMTIAARRMIYGKLLNSGQTCIAPDYVLCPKASIPALVQEIKVAIEEFYGKDVQQSASFPRIINSNHFDRITRLMDRTKGTVALGGKRDRNDLYIEPTVITGVEWDDALMESELFAPVLPILAVDDVREAIRQVNMHDQPLALYVFSKDNAFISTVMDNTRSGSVVANDTFVQAIVPELPFGGVGPSGHGAYHGKVSFDTFTHRRAAMIAPQAMEFANAVRYPPFVGEENKLLKAVFTGKLDRNFSTVVKMGTYVALVAAAAVAYKVYGPPS